MRPLLVVAPHELGQHRAQMLLVQHDDVVKTFSTQGPSTRSHDGVGLWRVDRRRDRIDPDTEDALSELAAIDCIPIAEQMARFLAQGVASMSCRHTQAAVGLAVTLTCTNSRRPWAMNTSTCSVLNVSVGTLSRSAAYIW
jgi:hypothetical protein